MWNTRQYMSSSQQCRPEGHEVRNRVFSISYQFVENAGDEGKSFRVVQSDTASESSLCEKSRLRNDELINLFELAV